MLELILTTLILFGNLTPKEEFKTCLEVKEWQTLEWCEGEIPTTEHDLCPIYCGCLIACFDDRQTKQACKFNVMYCYIPPQEE